MVDGEAMTIFGPNPTPEQRKLRALEDELDRLRSQVGSTQVARTDALPKSVAVAMEFVHRFQDTTHPRLMGCPFDGEVEVIWRATREEEDCAMDSACQLLQDYFDVHARALRGGGPRERVEHPEVEE